MPVYIISSFSSCRAGYYGDPSPDSPIGCRQCMCPGGEGSDYQHGETCQLDTRVNAVICDCQPGYTGKLHRMLVQTRIYCRFSVLKNYQYFNF